MAGDAHFRTPPKVCHALWLLRLLHSESSEMPAYPLTSFPTTFRFTHRVPETVPFSFLPPAKLLLTPGHLSLLFLANFSPVPFHKTGLFSSFQSSFKVSSERPIPLSGPLTSSGCAFHPAHIYSAGYFPDLFVSLFLPVSPRRSGAP